MNIAELREKNKARRTAILAWAKGRIDSIPNDVLGVILVILTSGASFGLGMLVERDLGQGSAFSVEKVPLERYEAAASAAVQAGKTPLPESLPAKDGKVYASANGSKYYFAWCSGLSRIATKNRLEFLNAAAAEKAGYSIAAGCSQ